MKKRIKYSKQFIVGQQYLKHEFRKIFYDIKDKRTWKRLDRSIDNFIKREGENSFWNLLAAISEGWKLKYVARTLSDTKYEWKLENFPIAKITLTGMSPAVNKYIIKKCKRDPLLFKKAWQDNKKMREEIIATGFSAHLERDHFPIFIYQKEDKFNVIDGMRRTLLNIIKGKNKIKAWVGYEKNKKGQPLISANRCLFLSDIYTIADKKDKELEKAIIRIGREIITDYSNGRDILIKRIAGWSRDPEIKRIFKKIK